MAYLGGVAVVAAFMLSLVAVPWLPAIRTLEVPLDRQVAAILVGGLMMLGVGLRDDIQRMGAMAKLFVQLAAAGLVVLSGVSIDGIWLSRPEGLGILSFLGDYETGGTRIDFGVFGVPLTIIWIVGATNALNIIDGLDSLASGLSVIACGAISWVAFQEGHVAVGLMLIALMGGVWAWQFNPLSGGFWLGIGHVIAGSVWAIFHILIITLQAFIFMTLTIVYLDMASQESH